MSHEESEMWSEYRQAQKDRRAERLPIRQGQIEELKKEGFRVRKLTDFQFRINELLDVYPTHNRFHDLKRKRRGGFRNVSEFVRRFFNV